MEKLLATNRFIEILENGRLVAEIQVLKAGGTVSLKSRDGAMEVEQGQSQERPVFKATDLRGVRVQIPVEGQELPVEIIAPEMRIKAQGPGSGGVPKERLRLKAGGEAVAEVRIVDGPLPKTLRPAGPVKALVGDTNIARIVVGVEQPRAHLHMPLEEQEQSFEIFAERIEFLRIPIAEETEVTADALAEATRRALERERWLEAFRAIPVLSVVPAESDLGDGWKRSRMLVKDSVSQPAESNHTVLPEPWLESKGAELRDPEAQVFGCADVQFDGPGGSFAVQVYRCRSMAPLVTNVVEGYRKTMIRNLGDWAVTYYGKGGMSLWFLRDNFKVVISAIGAAKPWKEDPARQHLARTVDKLIVAAATKAQSDGLQSFARANGEVDGERDVSIRQIIPTVAQLGEGWSSNRICALIDLAETPTERADPGESPAWLEQGRRTIFNGDREAYAMLRYYYREQPCTVWMQRWTSKDYMPTNWGQGKLTKELPGILPKVGEEVRFSQRDGVHNNMDFIRGAYLVSLESPRSFGIKPLRHLAEVVDENLRNALVGIKTFTHKYNSITVAACCERVSDDEIAMHNEEIKKKNQSNPPGVRSLPMGPTWRLHFWSNGAEGTNYCGYVWLGSAGGGYSEERLKPGIFDAMFPSKDLLLIIYGNKSSILCEERVLSRTGGVMDVRRSVNYYCNYNQVGAVSQIERAFLTRESPANVVATVVDDAGMTNKAVWTKTVGWTRDAAEYRKWILYK